MAKEKLDFVAVDVNTLTGDQSVAFLAYLEAKSALRTALQALAPEGYSLRFTEKYGTVANPSQSVLKVALVKTAAKADKAKPSLADWLAQQANSGHKA